jgi:hypothetical protein
MKKQILLIAVLFSSLSFAAHAQIGISVNIQTQPVWGPVGYDRADYYYLPDIGTYYDVNARMYTYYGDGRWITAPDLPPQYRGYDLYHGYKVVVNERSPWMHDDRYRTQYAQYRGRHDQQVIRDSHDQRYYSNPGHPQYNQWRQQHPEQGHGDQGRRDEGHDDHGDHGDRR